MKCAEKEKISWQQISIVIGADMNSLPNQSAVCLIFEMDYQPPGESDRLITTQYNKVREAY
jgi:hypothetical protein